MIWEGKEIYMNEIIVVNHVTKIIKNAALLDNSLGKYQLQSSRKKQVSHLT